MTRIGVVILLLRVVLVMGEMLLLMVVVVVNGIPQLQTRRERERMVLLLLTMLVHMRRRNRTAGITGRSKPRRPSRQMPWGDNLVWMQYRMCMRVRVVRLGIRSTGGGITRHSRRRRRRRVARITRLRYDFPHVRM